MQLYPINEIQTPAAQREAANYRAQGVQDDDMTFYRGDDGEEVICVNKRGVIALAKRSPLEPMQRLARTQALFETIGKSLDLNDELELLTGR